MISVTCLHSTLYYYTHILAAYRKNTQNRHVLICTHCTHMWAKIIRFLSDIRHWWLKINKESLISGSLRGNFWQPLIALGFYHFGKTNVRYSLIHLYTVFCCTSACIHSYKSTENFPRRLCRYGDRLIGWPFCYCQLCCWEHTR